MKIYNSDGTSRDVVLNERETMLAKMNQRKTNALGFDINVTTLTTLMKGIIEQKFFEIAPADYFPVRVGEGAWSQVLQTFRSYSLADNFETGIINTGSNNGRLSSADAGVDSVSVKTTPWAKSIGWTLPELEFASKAGNWDIVTAKENARKQNWDLGIQKIAFLGSAQDQATLGLLNQGGVTNNTTFLTKKLSAMSGLELQAFCAGILDTYRSNCSRTAWPTHFVIPESDYLGLAAPSNADFHIRSKLAVLEETFQIMCKNKNFQILPLAYGDAAYSGGLFTTARYALYNSNPESLRMDIPVDYTNTLANTVDNFSFQNVGYGQYSGVMAYRPAELMYFSF